MKGKNRINKRDVKFLIILFVAIIAVYFIYNGIIARPAGYIEITVNEKSLGIFSLSEEVKIPITDENGYVGNTLEITGGRVHMIEADCPDKSCVRQGFINKNGQTIICLPHRVVIRAHALENEADVYIR